MPESVADRLENYSRTHPKEVLVVKIESAGQVDEVMIYKGFSSSLVNPTNFDLDTPVIPEQGIILSIDRYLGPYNPAHPFPIQTDVSWDEFQRIMSEAGP